MAVCLVVREIRNRVRSLIDSDEFKIMHRMNEKDFTRRRKLGFGETLSVILKGAKRGLYTAMDEIKESLFFDADSCSEAAFCKARRKINPSAVEEVFRTSAAAFYQNAKHAAAFRGFRVWAIDGTKLNLPTTPETLEAFGSEPYNNGAVAQALASCLYDPLNQVILDAAMERHDANERELAERHIEALERFCEEGNEDRSRQIFTMDRGYPSESLLGRISKDGFRYVIRCNKNNFWREVRDAGSDDEWIQRGELRVRVVRLKLDTPEETAGAEIETMVTFLTNLPSEEYSAKDIDEFYRKRWGIESRYNFLKSRVEVENFTSLSPLCLRQDFYASLFLSNLVAAIKYDTEASVTKRCKNRKLKYHINYTETYRATCREFYALFLADSDRVFDRIYIRLRRKVCDALVPVSRDRPNPPHGKPHFGQRFSSNHKPS